MRKIFAILAFASALYASAQGLTLEQCVEQARQHNRSLQNAQLDVQSALEQKKEAFSKYFPQVSATATAFRAFDKIMKSDGTYPMELMALGAINPAFAAMAGQSYEVRELTSGYGLVLSLMQPLYTGGQLVNGNKLAKIGQETSELQYAMKEKDVVQKITENYWQIATVHYNLQTVQAAEQQLEAVLKRVKDLVEMGMTTRNAILKVQLREKELSSNRLQLEGAERVLTMLLAEQIGIDAASLSLAFPQVENVPALPSHVAALSAADSREELQLASKGVTANELQVKMERGKCLPTVAVGVMGYHSGFGGLSDNAKNYVNDRMTNGIAMATVSVPITDWWGGSHAIRRAKIKAQQSRNDYLDAQQMLAIDAEQTWTNLEVAYHQVEIARTSVEEAAENLRISTDQYQTGRETITDLLDAETLNRKAQNDLATAIATYQIRRAEYLRKSTQEK